METLLTLVGVGVVALWLGALLAKESRQEPPGSGNLASRAALLLSGPCLVGIAYGLGEHLVFPHVRGVMWPAACSLTGWPEWMEHDTVFYALEQFIAVGGVIGLSTAAAGAAVGRWRRTGPLEGYWLVNPMTIVLGSVVPHLLLARVADPSHMSHTPWAEYQYWDASTWGVMTLLSAPIWAWVFHWSNRWMSKQRRSESAA